MTDVAEMPQPNKKTSIMGFFSRKQVHNYHFQISSLALGTVSKKEMLVLHLRLNSLEPGGFD